MKVNIKTGLAPVTFLRSVTPYLKGQTAGFSPGKALELTSGKNPVVKFAKGLDDELFVEYEEPDADSNDASTIEVSKAEFDDAVNLAVDKAIGAKVAEAGERAKTNISDAVAKANEDSTAKLETANKEASDLLAEADTAIKVAEENAKAAQAELAAFKAEAAKAAAATNAAKVAGAKK